MEIIRCEPSKYVNIVHKLAKDLHIPLVTNSKHQFIVYALSPTAIELGVKTSLGDSMMTQELLQKLHPDITDCEFLGIPDVRPECRDVLMISGAAGAGKSHLAKQYTKEFILLTDPSECNVLYICPDKEDKLFRELVEDKLVKHIDPKIFVDMAEQGDPITIDDFKDADERQLFIFDDIEGCSKEQSKLINEFANQLCLRGRKFGMHVINIAHKPANRAQTQTILQELNMFAWPSMQSSRNQAYVLETYIQLNDKLRKWLKSHSQIVGRMLVIRQDMPKRALFSGKICTLVDDDEVQSVLKR